VFCVDAVLRAYAQTRFLFVMNVLRLILVVALISWCLSSFGLVGAVLVTLFAMSVVKVFSIARIAQLLRVRVSEILPWGKLTGIAFCAIVAAPPAYWISRTVTAHIFIRLVAAGAAYWVVYSAIVYAAYRWQHRQPSVARVPAPRMADLEVGTSSEL
jgi:hypothetical protein